VSEGYDLALEEWLGVLAELWTAAGKPLETDRLEVYGQSLGEVPLGLLEMASSVTRVAETADGGLPHWGATLRPPRLVAAGDPGKYVQRGIPAWSGVGSVFGDSCR
jgi:hypothetical protein